VLSFQSGHYADGLRAIDKLLADGKIPVEAHDRLRKNAQAARERLAVAAPGAALAPVPAPEAAPASARSLAPAQVPLWRRLVDRARRIDPGAIG
jgi:hypothetical protein